MIIDMFFVRLFVIGMGFALFVFGLFRYRSGRRAREDQERRKQSIYSKPTKKQQYRSAWSTGWNSGVKFGAGVRERIGKKIRRGK